MTAPLHQGFADPARDAARAFRAVMSAMARPGTIHDLGPVTSPVTGPAPLSPAAATVILTLCDPDTPLWLTPSHDRPEVRDWIAFQTGAPLSGAGDCRFALGDWAGMQPLGRFAIGTPDYPDRSATLIVDLPDLRAGGAILSGPGIRDRAALNLPAPDLLRQNAARFPLGFDCLFTSGTRIAALPRSTRIA